MQIDLWQILGGIAPLNWLILAICTAGFIGFYICEYRKWGLLSFNSYFFGFNFFLKIVLMYPLAWSANNIMATRKYFDAIVQHLDQAFYITLAGVFFMVLGMLAARVVTRTPPVLCTTVYRAIAAGWHSDGGVLLGLSLALGLTAVLFLLGFQPFVARSLVFERNDLRPFYNLWSQVVPFFAINLVVFGHVRRNWPALAAGLLLAGSGVIGGNRTVAILTLMQIGVMLGMPSRFRNLPLLLAGLAGLAWAAVWIALLRSPSVREQRELLAGLLYGNNLSDLRDFAWILTGMEEHPLLWGKTYLAGYLSFIPSYLFKFREEFGFGRVSPALAGLDPRFHSGLRPPIFGELFVNFGLPGVILGGFLYGLLVGRIIQWMTRSLTRSEAEAGRVPQLVVWTGFLVLQVVDGLAFTPAFFGVYVLAGLILGGHLLARIAVRRT